MKYVIEIEDVPFGRNDSPVIFHSMDELYRAKGFKSLVFDQNGLDKLTPYTEPDRKAIEDEVWKFINSITDNMSRQDRLECFGEGFIDDLTHNISYQEARTKHNIWQQAKREEESRIKIGDEVILKDELGVVVYVTQGIIRGYIMNKEYPKAFEAPTLGIRKTGRKFPQVAELLKAVEDEE